MTDEERQITFDDLEPVLSSQNRDDSDTSRIFFKSTKKLSGAGARLYERIQEQKEMERINDPYPF